MRAGQGARSSGPNDPIERQVGTPRDGGRFLASAHGRWVAGATDSDLAWRTVYGWFRRWVDKGLFETLMRALVRRQRRHCGRRPTPRLAIIDTQSVKCIGVRGPRGSDGAKKLVGRKWVLMVDAQGHILALAVVPADVQDCDTLPTLDAGKPLWPSLRLAIMDGVFRTKRCGEWCNIHGMRCRIVQKDSDQKGFVVLERRWIVERTFGWMSHWGGLLRERVGRLDVATGRLAGVACLMAANALSNPV